MTSVASGAEPALASATAEATAAAVAGPLPYAAGPISRLLSWLDAQVWRLVALTIALSVIFVAWAHAVLWSTGRLAPWALDVNAVVLVAYVGFFLVAAVIGKRIARGAIKAFWPATGWPDSQQAGWLYRFDTMPVRYEVAALFVGILVAIGATVAAPLAIVGPEQGRVGSFVARFPIFGAGYALNAVGVVLATRWLSLVAEIHRNAGQINPFDRVPIYAFSRLTVYVGLIVVGATYYTFTLNAPFITGNLPALVFMPATTVIGVAAFIVPLWGIHRRLVRSKEALLNDSERRITVAAGELYARIDARSFDAAKTVSDSLAGLNTLRDRVNHVPTWPWPPQLLRGFLTALFLPIVIYVITRVIGAVLAQ